MRSFLVGVALVAAALVAVGVASSDFHIYLWSGDPDEPPAAVRDVHRMAEAAHRTGAYETTGAVNELVTLAAARGGRPGLRLLQEQLPPLAAQLAGQLPTAINDVQAVEMETPVGVACRQAVLRLLARLEWLSRDLTGRAATEKALRRFITSSEAVGRSYDADLEKCLALTDANERAAVARVMLAL